MAKSSGTTRNQAPASNPQFKGVKNKAKQREHDYSMNDKYAVQHIKAITGIEDEELASNTLDAIHSWSSTRYEEMRAASRGEETFSEDKKAAELVESFINNSPKWHGGTTYRGLYLKLSEIDDYEVGEVFDPKGIASWSSSQSIAEGFTDNSKPFVLRCTKAQNGTSIKFGSRCPDEDEVTTSSKCRYRITNITKTTNKYGAIYTLIDVEPIANTK